MPIKTTFRGGGGADREDNPHIPLRYSPSKPIKPNDDQFPHPKFLTDPVENPTKLRKDQFD